MADIGSLTITQQLAGLIVGEPRNITAQHMRDVVLSIDNKINTGVAAEGDLKSDGTVTLTQNWNMGAFKMTALQFESNIVSGTPPFIVASTDLVVNLNADRVDGIQGANILLRDATVTISGVLIPNGNDTLNFGGTTTAWNTIFVNDIQPGAGQSIILRTNIGGAALQVASNKDIIVFEDLLANLDNSQTIGSSTVAFQELFVRDIRPTGTSLGLRAPNGSNRMSINNDGVAFNGNSGIAKPSALTVVDATAIDATYGTVEEDVLNNVRTRVNELETKLQNLGLLS